MTGWNLPPGCTDADIDRAYGGRPEYVYRVKVTRVAYVETWVEVEASSEEDASDEAIQAARKIPLDKWTPTQGQGVEDDFDAVDFEGGPPDTDPDDRYHDYD
jgi:hypothetical protein